MTMRRASKVLQETIEDPQGTPYLLTHSPLAEWPQPGDPDTTMAQNRLQYIQHVIDTTGMDFGNTTQETHRFLAHTLTRWDSHQAWEQTTEILHQAGSQNGGLPEELRQLTDNTLSAAHPLFARAAEHLANLDGPRAQQVYSALRQIQQAIINTASTPEQRENTHADRATELLSEDQDSRQQLRQLFAGIGQHIPQPSANSPTGPGEYVHQELLRMTHQNLQEADRQTQELEQWPPDRPPVHRIMHHINQVLSTQNIWAQPKRTPTG